MDLNLITEPKNILCSRDPQGSSSAAPGHAQTPPARGTKPLPVCTEKVSNPPSSVAWKVHPVQSRALVSPWKPSKKEKQKAVFTSGMFSFNFRKSLIEKWMKSWLIFLGTQTIKLASKFNSQNIQERKSNHKTGGIYQKAKQYSSYSHFNSKHLLMKGPKKPHFNFPNHPSKLQDKAEWCLTAPSSHLCSSFFRCSPRAPLVLSSPSASGHAWKRPEEEAGPWCSCTVPRSRGRTLTLKTCTDVFVIKYNLFDIQASIFWPFSCFMVTLSHFRNDTTTNLSRFLHLLFWVLLLWNLVWDLKCIYKRLDPLLLLVWSWC